MCVCVVHVCVGRFSDFITNITLYGRQSQIKIHLPCLACIHLVVLRYVHPILIIKWQWLRIWRTITTHLSCTILYSDLFINDFLKPTTWILVPEIDCSVTSWLSRIVVSLIVDSTQNRNAIVTHPILPPTLTPISDDLTSNLHLDSSPHCDSTIIRGSWRNPRIVRMRD